MRNPAEFRKQMFAAALVGVIAICTLVLSVPLQGAQTAQLATRLNPAVAAAWPLSSVPCGGVYHNFPRTMDTFAKWGPVPEAIGYQVQIDCMDCRQAGKWDSEVGAPFQLNGLTSSNVPHSFQFWGDNKGRWRARAVFGTPTAVRSGDWGPWCEFRFDTLRQPLPPVGQLLQLGRPTPMMRPQCGAEFHNFPRVINMYWSAVTGAQFYEIEIDCLDCTQVGKWDSEVGTSYHQMVGPPVATGATNATHPFAGDNQGRWRVRAGRSMHREREWGPWSEWCNFSFKTKPSEPGPSGTAATAKIVSVACAGGLIVNVHILIDSPAGIRSYSVWSTEAGGVPVDRTFVVPLPTHIDQVVTASHSVPDQVDRNHQWGLKVMVPGAATPIFTYGMEPQGADGKQRCPGHFQPLPGNPVPLS